MQKHLPILAALLLLTVIPAAFSGVARAADGTTLYVAPNGSDTADGSRRHPLATLTGARDAIRKLRSGGALPNGGVTVEVAGGTYEFTAPLTLSAQDGGSKNAPITYRAVRGQTVRLTGGRTVAGFRPVTDSAVRARLDASVRDQVVQADLKAQGITDYGALMPRGFGRPIRPAGIEVFCDDRPLTLARWPNDGFVRVSDASGASDRRIVSTEIAERMKRWGSEPELWAFGYWFHDWADSYDRVESQDASTSSLTFAAPGSGYGYRKGQRFYIQNALSELDQPGEWYLDRQKGILYLIPPSPLKANSVVVSVAPSLVEMDNASYVTLRGFTFEACRGDAVHVRRGEQDTLVACTLRNTGNRAIIVDDGATHSGVAGCDIYETGDGGIILSGGDRKSLTPAGLFADNNAIHDYSRWCRTYRPAIGISGDGNRVTHNLLFDGPHNAIQLSGNDHIVEGNELHNVCYETGDVGAFYTGRDWTARGTVIRNNYFHHISGPGHIGAMGVYLDDQASGFTITGNVFQQVTRAVFIGGGDDNIVDNNVFVDCVPSVHLDARGLGWQKAATDNPKDTLRMNYAAMPVDSPLWKARYPTLISRVTVDPAGAPEGNVVRHNISFGGRWSDVEAKARDGIAFADNLTDADPGFVNAPKNDFRLRPDSPAFPLGFQEIPVREMGLYKSDNRASWPVAHPVKATAESESATSGKTTTKRSPAPLVPLTRQRSAPLILEQGTEGEPVSPPSRVFVSADGAAIHVTFENTLENAVPIRLGNTWGQDDAIEVALKASDVPGAPQLPIIRSSGAGLLWRSAKPPLRGFPKYP